MIETSNAYPFEEAALYYDLYRAPYAPAALDYVVSRSALTSGMRVLDLGCGPGTIAIPLSYTGAEVIAIDRDPIMIKEAKRLAAERKAKNIQWIGEPVEGVLPKFGQFNLVTLGSSFHWMDRDLVLSQLKDVIIDGGALAILDEGKRRPQETWESAARSVAKKYLPQTGRHPLKHPEIDHEPSLMRSSHFSNFTVREFPFEITRDVTSILGCIYSWITSTKSMFGDQLGAFEAELTEVLLNSCPSGMFKEKIETAVYLAYKHAD